MLLALLYSYPIHVLNYISTMSSSFQIHGSKTGYIRSTLGRSSASSSRALVLFTTTRRMTRVRTYSCTFPFISSENSNDCFQYENSAAPLTILRPILKKLTCPFLPMWHELSPESAKCHLTLSHHSIEFFHLSSIPTHSFESQCILKESILMVSFQLLYLFAKQNHVLPSILQKFFYKFVNL